jgi:hypothetical protein
MINFLRFKRISLSKREKPLVSSTDSLNLRRRKMENVPKARRLSLVS